MLITKSYANYNICVHIKDRTETSSYKQNAMFCCDKANRQNSEELTFAA